MADNTDIVQQILGHLQSLKQTDYGTLGALGGAVGAYTNGNKVGDAYGASAADAASQAETLRTQMEQMPTLAAMYGADSPYAKQLQQTLARKDAAAGRNSQYGPRSVQLQAMLADKGSQYAQQQATMAQAYNTARSNANTQRVNAVTGQAQVQGQQLGSLFNLGEKSGLLPALNEGLSNMSRPYVQQASSALRDMFPTWSGTPTSQPMNQSPYSGGGDYSGYTTGSGYSAPEDVYQGAVNQPMDQSPYANYGGNYQSYTPGTSGTEQGLDTAPYNSGIPDNSNPYYDY
jgi:hypothetical protein